MTTVLSVMPLKFCSSCLSVPASRALVASSSSRMGLGLPEKTALAMASRWVCPSERPVPRSPRSVSMPLSSSETNSSAQAIFLYVFFWCRLFPLRYLVLRNDTMKHILIRWTTEKHHVADLAALRALFRHGEKIPALSEQREHAHPHVGIGQAAVLFKVFLVRYALTHQ